MKVNIVASRPGTCHFVLAISIKPIILFNSEIWGININKELEQFHLAFMKINLGVKKID